MNEELQLSKDGEALIKAFESCKQRAYVCPAGKLTIGWGHTNDQGEQFAPGARWSRAKCDAIFSDDMEAYSRMVRRRVKWQLTQGQFDALVSFVYNAGEGNLAKSTLLRKINRGDFDGAAREFSKWTKARNPRTGELVTMAGLVRRRASEALLFQDIPDRNFDGKADGPRRPDPMPQAAEPSEKPKSAIESKTVIAGAGVAATAAGKVVQEADKAVDQTTLERASDTLGTATVAKGHIESLGVWDVLRNLAGYAEFWFALAVLAGAGFIIWDRRRRLKEEQS